MPERRLALVREAFRRLDKTGDGVVKIDDLALAYDTSKHPLVRAYVATCGSPTPLLFCLYPRWRCSCAPWSRPGPAPPRHSHKPAPHVSRGRPCTCVSRPTSCTLMCR